MSTSIVIQNVDDATAKRIAEEAKRQGLSVEEFILQLIRKEVAVEHKSAELQPQDDLDSLAGTWTNEQAAEFLNAIADFENVDEKLWR